MGSSLNRSVVVLKVYHLFSFSLSGTRFLVLYLPSPTPCYRPLSQLFPHQPHRKKLPFLLMGFWQTLFCFDCFEVDPPSPQCCHQDKQPGFPSFSFQSSLTCTTRDFPKNDPLDVKEPNYKPAIVLPLQALWRSLAPAKKKKKNNNLITQKWIPPTHLFWPASFFFHHVHTTHCAVAALKHACFAENWLVYCRLMKTQILKAFVCPSAGIVAKSRFSAHR